MLAFLKTIALLGLALLFAATALLVPAHLRSVDRSVVKLAGIRGASVEDKIREELNAANVGPARQFIEATGAARNELSTRQKEILAQNPIYTISGGPDPYFEDFLDLIREPEDPSGGAKNALLSLFLPRSERALLSGMLAESSNRNVAALLDIRNQRGMLRLHPADHAAGAPYDAGVLTLALLVQGGHFKPGQARLIGDLATLAAKGTPAAIHEVEDFVLATLSLGSELDYSSLAGLAALVRQPNDWTHMATLFREQSARIPQLYTALRFSEAPSALFTYLAEYPGTGNADLDFAMSYGPGAVRYLLDAEKPIYKPASLAASVMLQLAPYRPHAFVSLTLRQATLGLLLKFALFFLAGLAFSLAMGAAWRGDLGSSPSVSKTNPAVMTRDVLLSLVVVLTIWAFFEPDLLKSPEPPPSAGPRIGFAVADALQSIKSPVKVMQELNQVTLLVLVLFFIIQLVVYTFCLIKIREIAKQAVSAEMKLKLLENEENLFDFGLYVGLGGTVLSLILVAVGIVEASLMAAYASTLFGILFVALLKVMHLRPYRRQLIVEADNAGTDSAALI